MRVLVRRSWKDVEFAGAASRPWIGHCSINTAVSSRAFGFSLYTCVILANTFSRVAVSTRCVPTE